MESESRGPTQPESNSTGSAVLKRLLQVALMTLLLAAASFGSAGTLAWPRGWIYLALYVAGIAATAAIAIRKNPEVIRARGKIRAGAKRFDKVILGTYTILLFASPVVAGLDAVRLRWTSLPFGTLYVGAALQVVATAPIAWVMAVNSFAEPVVRIQKERRHRLIDAGPYRFVCHPMYAGMILGNIAARLIWGSRWAFVPAGCTVVLFIVRTALEDRTLRRELPGYAEYAGRTPYRLVPAVW